MSKKKVSRKSPSLSELIPVMNGVVLDPEASREDILKAVGDVGDKLDAIEYQALSWEEEAAKFTRWYKPFQKRASALNKAAEWLRSRVKEKMLEGQIDEIPGRFYRAAFQRCADVLKIDIAMPLPTHYLSEEFKPYVIQTVSYSWDVEAIEKALKAGVKLSFARHLPNLALHIKPVSKIEEIE